MVECQEAVRICSVVGREVPLETGRHVLAVEGDADGGAVVAAVDEDAAYDGAVHSMPHLQVLAGAGLHLGAVFQQVGQLDRLWGHCKGREK